jgi:tripartite ATP-independent transporter DctM subunit
VVWIVVHAIRVPESAPADAVPDMSLAERWRPFLIHVAPLSILFLIVIGSLLAGFATPTESAALGSVAALGVGAAYRSLSWARIMTALLETMKLSVMILFIIAASQTFAQVLSFSGATGGLIRMIEGYELGPVMILLGMIGMLLLLGCFVDQVSMLMVTVPIFVPLAAAASIDPLILGVVYLLTMEIGLLTPPFGLLLFVMRGVAPPEIGMTTIYASIMPFILIKLAVLGLLLWMPGLATWLPSFLG